MCALRRRLASWIAPLGVALAVSSCSPGLGTRQATEASRTNGSTSASESTEPSEPSESTEPSEPSEPSWPSERSSDTVRVAGASTAPTRSLQATHLDVPGFLPAILLIPGGSEPRPLVAAAHGAGGSPEWECEYWARLTAGRAFVLCLRGTAMGGGSFYYKSHYALRDELAAALSAARAAQARIAEGGGIYAGFSQGASFGSLMIAERGEDFPYVVLIEGFTQWNIPLARAFAKHGGRRVSFVCGTEQCATKAELSARAIKRADLEARARHALGAGHTPVGEVMQLVERDLPWLVADDPLWR